MALTTMRASKQFQIIARSSCGRRNLWSSSKTKDDDNKKRFYDFAFIKNVFKKYHHETHVLKKKYEDLKLNTYLAAVEQIGRPRPSLMGFAFKLVLKIFSLDEVVELVGLKKTAKVMYALTRRKDNRVTFQEYGTYGDPIEKYYFHYSIGKAVKKENLKVYIYKWLLLVMTDDVFTNERSLVPCMAFNSDDVFATVEDGALKVIIPFSGESNGMDSHTFRVKII